MIRLQVYTRRMHEACQSLEEHQRLFNTIDYWGGDNPISDPGPYPGARVEDDESSGEGSSDE